MSAESADALEFLAQLQHNLRTPLTSILALGDLAADHWREWSDTERAETLRDIRVAAQQILRLSDRLADPACIPGAVIELRPQAVAWRSMFEVVRAGRPSGDDCSITLSGDVDVEFKADRARLIQVIDELVDNACRYAGSAALQVAVAESAAVLVVSDGGPGIPARVQEHIGEPFVFGLPPPGAAFHGLGLGLLAVSRITAAHGGRMEVDADENGTRVTVTLPRQ